MAQPQAYNREVDFTERDGDDTNHAGINAELDAAALSINQIRDNLALIQKDDGSLQNGIVGAEQLAPSAFDAVKGELNEAVNDAQQAAASATLAANTALDARDTAVASADAAGQSETNAAASAANAATAAQTMFNGLYLGAQATDPATDLNGQALNDGDFYYNTTSKLFRAYDASIPGFTNATPSGQFKRPKFVAGTDFTPGVTTALTLASDPITSKNVFVFFDGIAQHNDQFTIAGTTLTFTSPIPLGVSAVEVAYLEALGQFVPTDGSVTDDKVAANAGIQATKLAASDGAGGSLFTTVAGFISRLMSSAGASLMGFIQAGAGAVFRTVQDELRVTITPLQFGAVGDGVADDTAKIVLALNALQNGQTLDLAGRSYALFVGNNGVASGDAIALADVPRLFNKSNITIRNGTLFAASPGVSGTKVRYPTTLSFESCTSMRLENVILRSRGESYGDSDAGSPLGALDRARFSIQNGGHAFLFTRSKGLEAVNCRFERCGSTAASYVQSSDDAVFSDCYGTAMSLGYNAWCSDGWAGNAASLGYSKFETILNNCRSDKNGATYGSKGCVLGEDADVIIQVNGGVWKDAWANGSARFIGGAFGATSCKVYVRGAYVENCDAVGATGNTTGADTAFECIGVKARNIRTSMHKQNRTSFGSVVARYQSCDVEISGTQLWSQDDEFSVATVIANRKVTSGFLVEIIDCRTNGAHTFAMNAGACYGGIRVVGGRHTVSDRIFDSSGWGGAGAGGGLGYEIGGGAKFVVTSANPSTAKTAATTAINAIRNQDSSSIFTFQYIDFDQTATIECTGGYQNFLTLATLGSGLQERRILAEKLINCRQDLAAGVPYATRVKVVSFDGLSGSNVKVTFAFLDNKWPAGAFVVGDNAFANRSLLSAYAGPTVVGSELQGGFFVNGTSYNLTVGGIYNLLSN